MRPVDLLINARWIIPIEPEGISLPHHSLAIDAGNIIALLPTPQARASFQPRDSVDLPNHILLPGLVNAHCHAAMTLLRGIGDGLPLLRWLQEAIWPAENQHMSHGFVRDGTLLAAAEMLKGGITTCNDMYFHPDGAAEAFDLAGMRAMLGITVIDFPTPYAADADAYFRQGLATRERWQHHPLIGFALAPHAPYTVGDDNLLRCASLAAELDAPLHMHIHETSGEVAEAVTQTGRRPLERLAQLGLLGPNFLGVHAIHLTPGEMDTLARHGCAVAHCPSSNMKLASGIAPVRDLLSRNVCVALGTDGAASNNRLDLFQEMRHANLLAKVSTADATALTAHQTLRLATLNGAAALGLGHRIGSLLPGKAADLCAVSIAPIETQPCHDPASHLVHVLGREHVTDVWVAGKQRVRNGAMLLAYNTDLFAIASLWQNKLGNL